MRIRKGVLIREETSAEGTFGKLTFDDDFYVYTGELPWRWNLRGKSCVPAGLYLFKMADSIKHGRCYEEYDDPNTERHEDVPDRDRIQIHAANWMGDVKKGFRSELLGRIAPGMMIDVYDGQKALMSSKKALKLLEANLGGKMFELEIKWGMGIGPQEAA